MAHSHALNGMVNRPHMYSKDSDQSTYIHTHSYGTVKPTHALLRQQTEHRYTIMKQLRHSVQATATRTQVQTYESLKSLQVCTSPSHTSSLSSNPSYFPTNRFFTLKPKSMYRLPFIII